MFFFYLILKFRHLVILIKQVGQDIRQIYSSRLVAFFIYQLDHGSFCSIRLFSSSLKPYRYSSVEPCTLESKINKEIRDKNEYNNSFGNVYHAKFGQVMKVTTFNDGTNRGFHFRCIKNLNSISTSKCYLYCFKHYFSLDTRV